MPAITQQQISHPLVEAKGEVTISNASDLVKSMCRGGDPKPVLSVCIASMKRPKQLTRQVQRLLQISESLAVEIVVADASLEEDRLALVDARLTVLRLREPGGIDTDYDKAISGATGEYCWLLTDDDQVDDDVMIRLLPLLSPIGEKPSLVLIDARVFDPAGTLLQESKIDRGFPKCLGAEASAGEFGGVAELLTYIGSVVISRGEWLRRRSEKYVGTEFRHVGLILEAPLPGPVSILSPPAISIQYGVAHWEPRAVRVWTSQWPSVIRDSVRTPKDWESFYSASLPRQLVALLGFRARNLLPRAEVKTVYPHEKSRLKRAIYGTVPLCPPSIAAILVLSAARIARSEDRLLRFDIHRAQHAITV